MSDVSKREDQLVADASDQNLYAALLGDSALSERLGHCGSCRGEQADLADALENFRIALTELASPVPALKLPQPVAARSRRVWPQWRMATGLACATAVGVVAAGIAFPPHPSPRRAPAAVAISSVAAPISDEALLEGIDQDLSTSVPPSLAPLVVTATASQSSRKN